MKYSIIPEPKKFDIISTEIVFTLKGGASVHFEEEFTLAYDELCRFMFDDVGMTPEDFTPCKIDFVFDGNLAEEGYKISVKQNQITIYVSDGAGAFYAVQSLKQLFVCDNFNLPCLEIEDEPSFAVRTFMFDSSRYFFPKNDILTFLDIMALHKLNVFHWHITDDQGWRLELFSKLLLAQIGSVRAGTNFSSKPHGGFYSQLDIEEIIKYASARYIKIIPEIDTPGHVVSAISAYPELSCFNRKLDVATHSGVKHDVLCVGTESTYDFIFKVWDEAIELFGSDTVHLGGDEVPVHRWKNCPHCQAKMKELGLSDESKLHPYYMNRLNDYLSAKGIETQMWSSSENPGEYGNITQVFWGGKIPPKALLDNIGERKIINACSEAYYFDKPLAYISLKDTYEYNPSFCKNVIGVESCLWTEYVPNMQKAQIMLFPRLSAFAEVSWNGENRPTYDKYFSKLDNYLFLLRFYGYSYTNPRVANPKGIRSIMQVLYFERRRLHWQGLHNIIDDKKIEKQSKISQNT